MEPLYLETYIIYYFYWFFYDFDVAALYLFEENVFWNFFRTSINTDKVIDAMSLQEKGIPFNLPDNALMQSKRNKICIMGKTLNPESQKISDLIMDKPRK